MVVAALCVGTSSASSPPKHVPRVHVWKVAYRTHDGDKRFAYVVAPAHWTKDDPALPLIISPHGRGIGGRANARLWRALPADGPFVVVSPDGQGRRLARFSWGYRGQIDDLARMPSIVEETLPRIKIDRTRVFAVGGSMGGQEILLLAALHPKLLAGAAVFDGVADFAMQYWNFRHLPCHAQCKRQWGGSLGRGVQSLARIEVGGNPRHRAAAYRARSPISFARRLASSQVPVQFWWSGADLIVRNQSKQSGRLFERIRRLNPDAPVEAFVGRWRHSAELVRGPYLRFALQGFDLLSTEWVERPFHLHFEPPPDTWPWEQQP